MTAKLAAVGERCARSQPAKWFIFDVHEKNNLFSGGTTDLAAELVVVESRIRGEALNTVQTVEGVIIPVAL